MQSITLRSHVGTDGILHLQLPVELKNTDLEVTVTLRAVAPKLDRNLGVDLGWPEGFFERTFGSIPDLEREPQGELQEREPFD